MKKRILSAVLLLSILIIPLSVCGCGDKGETVKFLNYDTGLDGIYEEIIKDYEKEKGVKVKVQTTVANSYNQTLKSEMNMEDAPTIFVIDGVNDLDTLKENCADIKDSKLYSYLSKKNLAVTDEQGKKVYGIPYNIEAYGIIYNKEITDRYFALQNRNNNYSSIADVKSFEALKKVVSDMKAKKSELKIDGVFASASLSAGDSMNWVNYLLNIPLYYEFERNDDYKSPAIAALRAKEIDFRYSENYRNIFDLYTENSITAKELSGTKMFDDSLSEFAAGKVAMFYGSSKDFEKLSKISKSVLKNENIKFLPVYMGIDGEENSGLSVKAEKYLAINKNVSKEKQKASLDFLEWLYSSEKGKKYVTENLKFLTPFNTFEGNEVGENPLEAETVRYLQEEETTAVPVIINSLPGDKFLAAVGNALLDYVKGDKTYEEVEKTVKDKWKDERK